MPTSPFEFKLRDDETKREVELEIMRRIQDAVTDSLERDEMWQEYADQLEGLLGGTGSNTPWQGACELNDTITMEQFLNVLSAISAAVDRYPPVMVEATNKEDEKAAEMQEAYIPLKLNQGGFDKAKYDLIFNALRYPVAIGYVGHRQIIRQQWEAIEVDPDSGLEVEDDDQEPGEEYEEGYKSFPDVVEDGLESRCVDSPDFYLYPATQNDLQKAWGCGERMFWSQDELLSGIGDLDLDEEAVMQLIEQGPGQRIDGDNDKRQRMFELQGVSAPENDSDLYEVFMWFCKPPLLHEATGDGLRFKVPERYRDRDLCVICCPAADVVLRMGLSTHGHTRPYVPFYAWPIPGNFYGWCIPMLLNSIQAEANANIQHTINCMQMEITPVLKIDDTMLRRYENISIHPGSIIPYFNRPDEIQTLDFPAKSSMGLELQQLLDTKAEKVVTAGGYGTMPSKSRKAAEINATSQAAASKSDLILRNWNRGLETYWRQAAAILADNLPEEGEDFLNEEDSKLSHITPQMLKGLYIYRPVANGQNADPQARVAIAEAKNKAADEYLALKGNPQTPPDVLKLKWHNTRSVLRDMGEHAPEEWIGEEPSGEPPPAQPQAGAPQGQPGMPGMIPPPQPMNGAMANAG